MPNSGLTEGAQQEEAWVQLCFLCPEGAPWTLWGGCRAVAAAVGHGCPWPAPGGQRGWKAPACREKQGVGQQCSFTSVNIFCRCSSCVRKRNNLLCALNILPWEGMRPSLWATSLHQPLKPPEMGICWFAKARIFKFRLFAINSSLTSLLLSRVIILAWCLEFVVQNLLYMATG